MIKLTIRQVRDLKVAGCLLLACLMFVGSASGQGWERTFGANSEDYGEAVVATSDWGALVVGYSESFGSDNDLDVYVVRVDVDGSVLWTNVYDEAFEEHAYGVVETADGGFVIAGDIINRPGEKANAYLLKINADGVKEWSYQYGSPDMVETFNGIAKTTDGGFVMTGSVAPSESDQTDVLLIKVSGNGQQLWKKTYGGAMSDIGMAVEPFKGGYVLAGSMDNPDGSVGKNVLLIRTDTNGNSIWTKSIGTNSSEEAEDLVITKDEAIVVAGHVTTNKLQAYIAKFDENGTEVWSRAISKGVEDMFKGVVELPNGHLVAAGLSSLDIVNVDLLIAEVDENGQDVWLNNQGREETYEAAEGIALTPDGGFVMVGFNGKVSGLFNDLIVVKTDGLGNTYSASVSGKIFFDRDGLCDQDINDDPIEGWLIKVESSDKTYFGTSDAEGNYEIQVDTGEYRVNVLLPTNLWKTCIRNGYEVQLLNLYDNAQLNFPVSVAESCPYLEVEVSSPVPPVCMKADYFLDYRNVGTTAARNVRLEVSLDETQTVDEASLPYSLTGDNRLVFQLGNLLPFQGGQILLTVSSCEDENQLLEGEAVKVEARIFSDVDCAVAPGPAWDGSSIEVTGACAQDSIFFDITNTGDGDMSERRAYGVIEDLVLIRQDSFQLNAGEFTRVFWKKGDGKTYRIIAEQAKDHPGLLFPTFAVESCKTLEDNRTGSVGFVTMFPENDRDPNISIDVQEAFSGSAPEVELRGYPKGYRNLFIAKNTDLTYKITFNNFGTDTIDRVVIRDTLPPELDITRLMPGASSHPYTFEIYEEGILKITFSDIRLLPGGSTDAGSSGGFVNFRISQKLNNPVGTVIQNSAAIFLGYNSPVQTNIVTHEVGNFPDFLDVMTNVNKTYVPDVKIKVSPNPFSTSTMFEIEGREYRELIFDLYDLQGKLLRRERHNGNKFEFYRNHLTAGMYFYTIRSREQIITTGKLLVQ